MNIKEWIDNVSYEELLRVWRFTPPGNPLFEGEMGEYYSRKIAERRKEVGEEEHTRVSKKIGWEKR